MQDDAPQAVTNDTGRGDRSHRGRRRARRAARGLAFVFSVLLVLLVAVVLALQFEGVSTRIVNEVARRVSPWPDATLSASNANLDGLGRIRLTGVRLVGDGGEALGSIDTLRLRVRPIALMRGDVILPEVHIRGAEIIMRQQPDTTWDLLSPFTGTDTVPQQRSESGLIRIDEATVERSRVEVRFQAAQDSVLRIEDITLRLEEFSSGDSLRAFVDTLDLRILPPTRDSPAHLSARARLADGRLAVDGLRLVSDSSDVRARGTLLLPGGGIDEVSEVDFTMSARPLDFRDIGSLVPGFDAPGSLRLEARIGGTASALRIDAEARSNDGATLRVAGTLTPRTEGPVSYVLEGEIRNLDPSLWGAGAPPMDGIDADFDIALSGPALDSLDGSARIRADGVQAAGTRLDRLTLDATFEDGLARFTLATAARPWANVDASGTIRPFGEDPAYDLTVAASQLGALGGDGAFRITGGRVRARLEGAGFSPDAASGRGSITLAADIGRAALRDGSVVAEWSDGEATARVVLPIDEGSMRANILAGWGGERLRLDVRSLDVNRLDIAAMLGDTVRTLLTAAGSGELMWRDARSSRADFDFAVENAVWGDLRVDTARAEVQLRAGRLTADVLARSGAGSIDLEATAQPFDAVPEYRVTRLDVRQVDLSQVKEGLPVSRIDATASLSFTGRSPAQATGAGTIAFDSARIGGTVLDQTVVDFLLADGGLQLGGDANVLDGRVSFDARMRPFDESRPFTVERARFENIAIDSLSGGRIASSLSGTLRLEGRLPADALPVVAGTLELDGSTFNQGRIDDGHVEFALQDGVATLEARVETGEGEILADGRAMLDRTGPEQAIRLREARLDVVIDLPDIAALAGRDTLQGNLDARIQVAGTGLNDGRLAWDVLVAAEGDLDGTRLDTLRLDARIANDILRLDTLILASNVVNGSGGGAVSLRDGGRLATNADGVGGAADPPLRVRLVSDSISAITTLLGIELLSMRSGRLDLTASNIEGGIRTQVELAVAGLIARGIGADSIHADLDGLIQDRTIETGEGTVRVQRAAFGSARFEEIATQFAYRLDTATFAAGIRRDETHDLTIAGRADINGRSATLDRLGFVLVDDEWQLQQPTTISWAGPIRIDELLLVADGRRIAIDGVIDREGQQDLTLSLDSVPLDGFAEFAGLRGVVGMLDGTVRLDGPATDVSVSGDLSARVSEMVADMTIETEAGQLTIDASAEDGGGNPLTVRGSLPFALSIAPDHEAPPAAGALALQVAADSFSLGWLTPLLEQTGMQRLEGRFSADASFRGTADSPDLSGTARVVGGRISIPDQGIEYDDVRVRVTLDGSRIHVDTLRMRAEGTAAITGDIVLDRIDDPRFELEGRFDRFRAARNEWTRLGLSGDIRITGDLQSPDIRGNITVDDTDFYADPAGQGGGGGAVTLTEDDYEMLRNYFGYIPERDTLADRDLMDAWAMNVDVALGTDVWARKRAEPEMRLQLGGSLDVRKEPGDSIRLFGTIEVDPRRSFFQQFGRRFSVSEGSVTFNGSIWSWVADLDAEYEVPSFSDPTAPEVVITLSVTGGWENLSLVLGAQPSLETSDILSYLATGRPAASAAEFGGSGGGVLGTGASFAVSRAASFLEDAASETVGLDVVEIRQDGLRGATLVAGRYVSPRLYVGFQQSLTLRDQDEGIARRDQGTQVEVEYSLYRWLLLNLQGGQSDFRFFFRSRRAF
jgi:translocation and assembly module TamB